MRINLKNYKLTPSFVYLRLNLLGKAIWEKVDDETAKHILAFMENCLSKETRYYLPNGKIAVLDANTFQETCEGVVSQLVKAVVYQDPLWMIEFGGIWYPMHTNTCREVETCFRMGAQSAIFEEHGRKYKISFKKEQAHLLEDATKTYQVARQELTVVCPKYHEKFEQLQLYDAESNPLKIITPQGGNYICKSSAVEKPCKVVIGIKPRVPNVVCKFDKNCKAMFDPEHLRTFSHECKYGKRCKVLKRPVDTGLHGKQVELHTKFYMH